ncbi:hypothetical protein D018_3055B, partial [Vibrio parahaemolyticus VP2007-007]
RDTSVRRRGIFKRNEFYKQLIRRV